ncbi:hypothetical protein C5167_011479 [Papaver somniferum]|uniref:Pectinesterase inhibitor domain-containing protein n=1 Tax=Papaver somniferum TaxID=3469 RepID=A0A4Y7K4M9_PAPSO|nr:putative invertase inhibitor [Papaver somniferum]RZC67786.1 hypothetical protein C5167_011479 [Papaver somniferum]
MNPSFSLPSFFIVFLVLNFHNVNGDLIKDVCKNASKNTPPVKEFKVEYDFCVASLMANPKSKDADLRGLGVISMQTCLQNATSVHSYIGQLLKDRKTQPIPKSSVNSCFNRYRDAIRSVQKATSSFKTKDFSSANIQMSAAMEASIMCEYEFEEVLLGLALPSPLTKQNGDFFQLTGISLAITNMIK